MSIGSSLVSDRSQGGSQSADSGAATAAASDLIETGIRNLQRQSRRLSTAAFLERVDQEQQTMRSALGAVYPDSYAGLLALKICNLIVARFHFIHRHSKLASGPIQLMVDPANSCPLKCPGCVHSGNPDFKDRYDWPGGLLSEEGFEAFIRLYGPTAFGVVFYNYGEPMLNKRTPLLIRSAKRYYLHTSISSNFTVPFDAEAVVNSGLNCIFASLDGATQETLAIYRRGGDIGRCFENIRLLVDAKRRLGSPTPYVEWKFLTFEHNIHEIDLAVETGEKLGVDEVHVAPPFAVDWDDPSIQVANAHKGGRYVFSKDHDLKGPLDRVAAFEDPDGVIDNALDTSWVERGRRSGAIDQETGSHGATCRWLYQSMTIDAAERIHPCCMPPERGSNRVYGSFGKSDAEGFNNAWLSSSRDFFADRAAFETTVANDLDGQRPYCSSCRENPALTYTLSRDVRRDIPLLDRQGLIPSQSILWLTGWPDEGRIAEVEGAVDDERVRRGIDTAAHIIRNQPKLHVDEKGNPASWGIESDLIEELPRWLRPDDRTIETGAGLSTVMFCAMACDHVVITPDSDEVDRIRDLCRTRNISLDRCEFIVDTSDRALPTIEGEFKVALVDGNHGFPTPFLDWYYLAQRLETGGLMVLNATAIFTVKTLVEFMAEDPRWEQVVVLGGSAVFRKLTHDVRNPEWNQQPFVKARSE
jgi:MoaA/NifB/PqqE/SkfB family radical SAM enzyme/precorrin-6B methylase 2